MKRNNCSALAVKTSKKKKEQQEKHICKNKRPERRIDPAAECFAFIILQRCVGPPGLGPATFELMSISVVGVETVK